MTCNVLMSKLNPTHSLTGLYCQTGSWVPELKHKNIYILRITLFSSCNASFFKRRVTFLYNGNYDFQSKLLLQLVTR